MDHFDALFQKLYFTLLYLNAFYIKNCNKHHKIIKNANLNDKSMKKITIYQNEKKSHNSQN